MTTRAISCPVCGQPVSPSVGECLYCSAVAPVRTPPSAEPPPPPATPVPRVSTPAPPPPPSPLPAGPDPEQRALGLLLFEAEESLARGQGDKALVLASRAVKERPDSITARALYERARRDVLKGRRRDRLEARVSEAQGLLERGEYDGAERIVTSALKLIPDHPAALSLFSQLKERRLGLGTAESEAERELEKVARDQAGLALAAARAHLAAGRERIAILTVRKGLRLAPDHPELLATLGQLQDAWTKIEADAAQRRALHAQVRLGTDLLTRGQLDESLRILRAVLVEDPDHARAQSAIQEVRQEWRRRNQPPPVAEGGVRAAHPASRPAAAAPAPAPWNPLLTGPSGPAPASPPPRREPPPSAPAGPVLAAAAEVLLPRTRRQRTPWRLIFAAAGLVFVVLVVITTWSPPWGSPLTAPSPGSANRPALDLPPTTTEPPGPLTDLVPELRGVIEATLADYAKALESQDAALLARARPDLSAAKREELLAPFQGALNVATDLRVLDVIPQGRAVLVPLLRTDVIVGGRGSQRPPVEETLRFEWRDGVWVLRQGP